MFLCARKDIETTKSQQKELLKTILRGVATYDSNNRVLTLKKRGSSLTGALAIKDDKNYFISYKPEKYIYTSATVGGITTGGVTKTGGYNYISGSQKSGKYQILYYDDLVSRIALTEELFLQAKESPIAKYLDESTKEIVVIQPIQTSLVTKSLLASGNINAAMNLGMKESKEGYPSYEKCTAILNWICTSDIDEQSTETETTSTATISKLINNRITGPLIFIGSLALVLIAVYSITKAIITIKCVQGDFSDYTCCRCQNSATWRLKGYGVGTSYYCDEHKDFAIEFADSINGRNDND